MITFTETKDNKKCDSCKDSKNISKKFYINFYGLNKQILVCDKCLTDFYTNLTLHREKYDSEFRRKYYDNL